jgi:hypothetical protein
MCPFQLKNEASMASPWGHRLVTLSFGWSLGDFSVFIFEVIQFLHQDSSILLSDGYSLDSLISVNRKLKAPL